MHNMSIELLAMIEPCLMLGWHRDPLQCDSWSNVLPSKSHADAVCFIKIIHISELTYVPLLDDFTGHGAFPWPGS